MNLASVDLNLLVALDALLKERSVTRAAKRVGLTQPAMSNALSRLRALLGDPVLVRTPAGMRPTPRAEGLAAPLAEALRQIHDTVLTKTEFDPKTARLTFNIASADYEMLVLVPPLVEHLAEAAPGIRLHVTAPRGRLPIDDLAEGRIDLSFGIHRESHAGLYQTEILSDRYLCAMHKGHPDAEQRLTLPRYAAMGHLLISPFGGMSGSVDQALAAHGLERTVMLAVPHFALAPFLLIRTPYVLTLPERTAKLFAAHLDIKLVKPPIEIPGFTDAMFWHERCHADPAHKWLRETIRQIAAKT